MSIKKNRTGAATPGRFKSKQNAKASAQAHTDILHHPQKKQLEKMPVVCNLGGGISNPNEHRCKDESILLGVQRDKAPEKRANNLTLPVFPMWHRTKVTSPQSSHLSNSPGVVQAKHIGGCNDSF